MGLVSEVELQVDMALVSASPALNWREMCQAGGAQWR